MTRRITTFVFLLALLASGLVVLPASSLAGNSPIKMPVTLLDLYRKSDAIFEARYARTEEGEIVRQDDDYVVLKTKKHFDIYSTIKGNSSKFFELAEEEYRYSRTASASYLLADTRAQSDVENTYGLRSGDSVLLFVKYTDDHRSFELTDDEEGLKKLSSDEIGVYQKRIGELASLLSDRKPDTASLVEWLVRCAEEPATRWEGTFELVKGFERLEYQERQRKNETNKPEEVRNMIVTDESDTLDSSVFARALTAEQKGRLANVLLAGALPADSVRIPARGDRELIDLVKKWGDPRLADFLLEELKTRDLTDYRRAETMRLIADILRDPNVSGLADDYNRSYRSEAIAAEMFREQEQVDLVNGRANDNAARTDYRQVRTGIVSRFIQRASSALAHGRSTEN